MSRFSGSVLDHVISNSSKIVNSGVLDYGFSDHLVVFCARGQSRKSFGNVTNCPRKFRSLKNYSKESLSDVLKNVDWRTVITCTDVNESLSEFMSIFKSALDIVAPCKEMKIKLRTEPWITVNILTCIRERDRLLVKFKSTRDYSFYEGFCKIRNKIQRDVRHAKENYFKVKLEENRNDLGKLFQQLSSLGYSDKCKGGADIVLEIDGDICTDKLSIAGSFNCYFTSVASSLVQKLPPPFNVFSFSTDNFRRFYYRNIFRSKFCLSPVSSHDIFKLLSALEVRKATGIDDVSS